MLSTSQLSIGLDSTEGNNTISRHVNNNTKVSAAQVILDRQELDGQTETRQLIMN